MTDENRKEWEGGMKAILMDNKVAQRLLGDIIIGENFIHTDYYCPESSAN